MLLTGTTNTPNHLDTHLFMKKKKKPRSKYFEEIIQTIVCRTKYKSEIIMKGGGGINHTFQQPILDSCVYGYGACRRRASIIQPRTRRSTAV